MKKQLLILIISSTLFYSCSNKKENSTSDNSGNNLVLNALTSSNWCSMENLDSKTAVVTRFELSGSTDKGTMTYSRITFGPEKIVKTYPMIWRDGKRLKEWKGGNEPSFLEVAIELHGSIDSLYSTLSEQKRMFDFFITKNKNLKGKATSFTPSKAITIRENTLLSDNEGWVLFPCESYAEAFNANEVVRPEIEFRVLMGQAVSRGITKNSFIKLKEDIEQVEVSPEFLSSRNWCMWYELDTGGTVQFKLLTFAEDKVIRSEQFIYPSDSFYTEERQLEFIQEKMSRDNSYSYNYKGSEISIPVDKNFSYKYKTVKDAEGRVSLIEDNDGAGIFSAFDFFFDCTQGNAKSFLEPVNLYQDTIIELQTEKLELEL